MAEYQGHRSWNAWNVALYIDNEESIYRAAVEALQTTTNIRQAVTKFCRITGLRDTRTPDGGVYNTRCIKEALEGLDVLQLNQAETHK